MVGSVGNEELDGIDTRFGIGDVVTVLHEFIEGSVAEVGRPVGIIVHPELPLAACGDLHILDGPAS